MSPRLESSDRGQLALMDAMVFFTVMLLICSLQLSMCRERGVCDDMHLDLAGRCDPDSVLPVLLKASIGVRCVVSLGSPLEVLAYTTVAECIAAEAVAVLRGASFDQFDVLNEVILGIAANISHPLLVPHIVLYHECDDDMTVLLRIERRPPSSEDLIVACCGLPEGGDVRLTVSFQLEPALLLEGVDV